MVRKDKSFFSVLQPLRAWNDFMPFPWLVPAFGMPAVGLQVHSLTRDPQTAVSWQAFGFAGMAVLALAGLSLILLRVDQEYYGDDVNRAKLSAIAMSSCVPPREAFLAFMLLLIAGGWSAWSSGWNFLAFWGILAALMAADVFLLHRNRLTGSLTAAAVAGLQCLLTVMPVRHPSFPVAVAVAMACGFGLLLFFVTMVALYTPKVSGPVRAGRLREAWYPFIVQVLLSAFILCFLVTVSKREVVAIAAAVAVLALGVWRAHRISKPLTRLGIMPRERETIDAYYGIPVVCLQAALLLGVRETLPMGAALLGAMLGVEWFSGFLQRRVAAPQNA